MEAKEYRRRFTIGGKEILWVEGQFPGHGTYRPESLVRSHSFGDFSPLGAENPQAWTGSDLDTQNWGDPGYTLTQGAAHEQLQRQMPTRGVPERKQDSVCTWAGGGGRP